MCRKYQEDSREVAAKVHIYFDGIDQDPFLITRDDYLVDFTLLEELSSDTDHPIGQIAANELNLSLYSQDRIFDSDNVDSPLYGKIQTKVPIRIYLGDEEQGEWELMGTFYVAEWSSSSDTSIATISAYDCLLDILQKEVPVLPIYRDIPVSEYLTILLTSLGISASDILIDSALSEKVLDFAFAQEGSFGNTIQKLAEAYLFYFYVGRDSKFRALSLATKNSIVDIWDYDFIYNIQNSTMLLRNYSGVAVTYEQKAESEVIELAKVDDLNLPPGELLYDGIKPQEGPIVNIEYLKYNYQQDVNPLQYMYHPWQLGFILENPTKETINLSVGLYGTCLQTVTTAVVHQKDAAMVSRIGEKNLGVQNPYITARTQASTIGDFLLTYMMSGDSLVSMTTRGTPKVTLGDTVQIQHPERIEDRRLVRQQFRYDGALTSEVSLTKYIEGGGANAF